MTAHAILAAGSPDTVSIGLVEAKGNKHTAARTAAHCGYTCRVVHGGSGEGLPVRVVVPAGGTVELTAAELETGDAEAIVSGTLGDADGGWRLTLDAGAEVDAERLRDR